MEQEVEKLGVVTPGSTDQQCKAVVSKSMDYTACQSNTAGFPVKASIMDTSATHKPTSSPPSSPQSNIVNGNTRKVGTPSSRGSGQRTSSPQTSVTASSPGLAPFGNGVLESECSAMANLANSGLSVITPISPEQGQSTSSTDSNGSLPKTNPQIPQNSKAANLKASGVVSNLNIPNVHYLSKPSKQRVSQASLQLQSAQKGLVPTAEDHSCGIQLLCDLLYQDGAIPGQLKPMTPMPPTTVMTPTSLATPTTSETTEKRQQISTHPSVPGKTPSPRRNKISGRPTTPKSNNRNKETGRKRNSPFSIESIVNSSTDGDQPTKVSRLSPSLSSFDIEGSKSTTSLPFSIANLTKSGNSGSFYKSDIAQSQPNSTPSKGVSLASYGNVCTTQVSATSQAGFNDNSALGSLSNYVISASASIGTKTVPTDVLAQTVPSLGSSKLDCTQRVNPPAPIKEFPKDLSIGTSFTPSSSDSFLAKLLPLVTYESLHGGATKTAVSQSQKSNVTHKVTLPQVLPNLEPLSASLSQTTLPLSTQTVTGTGVSAKQTEPSSTNQPIPLSIVNSQQHVILQTKKSDHTPQVLVAAQQDHGLFLSSQKSPTTSTTVSSVTLNSSSNNDIGQNFNLGEKSSVTPSSPGEQEIFRESTSPDSEVRSLLSKESMPQSPLSHSPVQNELPGRTENRPLVLVDSNPCSSRSPIQLPTSPAVVSNSSSLPSFGSVFSPNKECSLLQHQELG